MNTSFLSLSSSTTSLNETLPVIHLDDYTNLWVFLSGMSETLLPISLEVNWGDGGAVENYENDILQTTNIIEDRYSSIFFNSYNHEYTPAIDTSSKSLTATYIIKYFNNNECIFNVPIEIINKNYTNSIEDMYLVNTIILPDENNSKIHQFVTKIGGYMVEMRTSVK
jgi:hypothetical protein